MPSTPKAIFADAAIGAKYYLSDMFDRIMENSMAIWILVSATYPIFLFGMVFKAVRHYQRLHAAPAYVPSALVAQSRFEREDWIPSR